MITVFNSLLNKFNNWKEAKESTPLSAESAYTLSSINKETTLEQVYNLYKKEVLDAIKNRTRYNESELYLAFPSYLIKEHKERLAIELTNLNYKVLYNSAKSMIISWDKE